MKRIFAVRFVFLTKDTMLDSGGPWLGSVVSLLAIAAVLTRFDVMLIAARRWRR